MGSFAYDRMAEEQRAAESGAAGQHRFRYRMVSQEREHAGKYTDLNGEQQYNRRADAEQRTGRRRCHGRLRKVMMRMPLISGPRAGNPRRHSNGSPHKKS